MPVASMRSGTVIPSSGASDRAAHRIASGASSAPSAAVSTTSADDASGGSVARCCSMRLPRYLIERRPEVGVPAGRVGDGLVGDEVGAGSPGRVVLGGRDQELAGRVERVGVPARGEHALAEDEVDVLAFADAEADPDVHLRAHRALAHGLLRRPLGRGDEVDGDGASAPGDGVGVLDGVGCVVGELGVLIDDDDQRGHVRCRLPDALSLLGEQRGAGLEDGDRVGEQGAGLLGVVASRSMHDAQGPSSMPFFRSMPQMTTSAQATRLPMSTLSPPLLPAPVAPPNRPCRRRNSTRHGTASSNGPRSMGSVIDVTDGPGQMMASACGSVSSTRSSQRLARSSGVGWTRTAPRKVPRPDSMRRYLRDHVADGLAARQAETGPPAPHVHRGGHDLRSGQPDGLSRSPATIRACGQRGPWRGAGGWPTREARRSAVRPAARTGIGGVAGPSAVAAVSHPPATTVTALA